MELNEKQQRMVKFWKKFLRLTRGRVTVLKTLDLISTEERNQEFSKMVAAIKSERGKGTQLSEAISMYPSEFSKSVIELIKTAEKSGAWDEILEEITGGLEDGTFE